MSDPDEAASGRDAAEDRSVVGRRAIIAGLAGAAAVTVASGSGPAEAASGGGDQGALILGSNSRFIAPSTFANTPNVSSVATDIVASPNYANYTQFAGNYIFRADARPAGTNAHVNGLEGYASGLGNGVRGDGGPTGTGVRASGYTGVVALATQGNGVFAESDSGAGVFGASFSGLGGWFQGGRAPIRLVPHANAGAPTTAAHTRGELVVDNAGVLWLCKADGTPGTWVKVSEQAATGPTGPQGPAGPPGPAAAPGTTFRVLPTPERFIDTRSGLGGVQGPVPGGTISTFQMTGRNGESGNAALQIPDAATILVGNLSVIGGPLVPPASFVTMWPTGPRPTTSSISFGPGQTVANAFTVGLSTANGHGNMNVFAQQSCDYIVDVVGYYS